MPHSCEECHCQEQAIRERCECFDLDECPEDIDLWCLTYVSWDAVERMAA